MQHSSIGRATSVLLVGLLAHACAGGPPADPQQIANETQRLLRPYAEARQIGCEELTVELTANFSVNVSRPAEDPILHRRTRRTGDGYIETEWINLGGDPTSAFTVTIGEVDLDTELREGSTTAGRRTSFTVLRAVRLRVLTGRRELTLDADAEGGVFALAAGKTRELREFRVRDGILQER